MTRDECLTGFDPNAPALTDAGIFGLPFSAEHADIIIIPVAWEATVSFGSGAADAPEAILRASAQIDLHHHDYPKAWRRGMYLDRFPDDLIELNRHAKDGAHTIIGWLESGRTIAPGSEQAGVLADVEAACERMNAWVRQRCAYWKGQGKQVGLLGGDHSIPLGCLHVHAEEYAEFGVLHIDAHHDLRVAYEGFTCSHASIFYNALERVPAISKLVQVGIRDYCEQEYVYARNNPQRIAVYYDRDTRKRLYHGETWHALCREIVAGLPQAVHVSIDIDGLDPKLCPHTGTPVPGGLEFEELMFLLNELKNSGREIIGFDLCEVVPGPDGWDANTGARVLYHLCALMAYQPDTA